MESRLTAGKTGNATLTVNLNHPVESLELDGNRVASVRAHDMLGSVDRWFRGKIVVLAAGTIESAKIAQVSRLNNPKIGYGITDHPIYYAHFALPDTSKYYTPGTSSKFVLQHRSASTTVFPCNIVIELGSDFNQGRFIDDDIFDANDEGKGKRMLCEIVFMFDSPLVETNSILMPPGADSYAKPELTINRSPSARPFLNEITDIKNKIINLLGGEQLYDWDDLNLKEADLGGVAHEVGSLRIGEVVDENLKFKGYSNLYVSDLSVFPTSPAANPTLTLTALSNRLAAHIVSQLRPQ